MCPFRSCGIITKKRGLSQSERWIPLYIYKSMNVIAVCINQKSVDIGKIKIQSIINKCNNLKVYTQPLKQINLLSDSLRPFTINKRPFQMSLLSAKS